jgi:hypothetical protein
MTSRGRGGNGVSGTGCLERGYDNKDVRHGRKGEVVTEEDGGGRGEEVVVLRGGGAEEGEETHRRERLSKKLIENLDLKGSSNEGIQANLKGLMDTRIQAN